MPKARTVSLVIAVILLIVGVAVGAGTTYFATHPAPTPTPVVLNTICNSPFITNYSGCTSICSSGRTLTMGMLLDLSSTLSTQGTRSKNVAAIAITDINAFLSSGGCNLKFATAIDDYALNDQTALTDLQNFAASGVQVVVGPLNSGTAQAILTYANSNHIVLISPSSTSPALAISNDYLFRTVPNDAAQGLADARIFVDRGATAAIIIHRDDTYGDGLANATKVRFESLGGTVIASIPYDHNAADAGTLDWTTTLNTLNTEFNNAVGTYGASKIAIYAVTFEEFGQMIIRAQTDYTGFPWSTLPWFGTDGAATLTKIISGSAGAPVSQVKLASTLFASVNNSKTLNLYSKFTGQYPSLTCDSYCLGAYDDVWLGAVSTLQAGSYNGTAIHSSMLGVASSLYGVTGRLTLQASGDRLPTGYQIWSVVTQTGTPAWVLAGSWDDTTDTVTWTNGSGPP